MQLRCQRCHRPFAIGKDAVHAALDMMVEENLSHYDAVCPHCKRTNRVSMDELQRGAPDWQKPDEEEK